MDTGKQGQKTYVEVMKTQKERDGEVQKQVVYRNKKRKENKMQKQDALRFSHSLTKRVCT